MESNLSIKTSKLNIETVSSAVFGKDEGGSNIGDGSGESIRNIHKTLSKLSGHVRKSLVRIKELEFNILKITPKLEEVEKKVIVNAEKITKIKNIIKTQKSNIGEKIPGNDKNNFTKSLIETNKILVGIQQQLALDSAMRVADQRKKEDVFKRSQSRKKLNAEESALEKTAKNIGKGVKKVVGKVLSPVKNFFADLLDFLLTVGAGIAVNAAFEWLKEPKNREQLDQWFGWVAKNWKWIAGITAGILLLQPILSIVGAIGGAIVTIKAGLDIFNFIRRRLFGGGGKPPGPPGGPKPRDVKPRGGIKPPKSNFKPPKIGPRTAGLTSAGSNFNLEQARNTLTKSGDKFKSTPPNFGGGLKGLAVGAASRALLLYSLYDTGKTVFDPKDNIITSLGDLGTATYNMFQTPNKKILFDVPEDSGRRSIVNEKLNQRILKQREEVEQRERGGPIAAGKPYLVGEGGPELVVPKVSGTVINNMKTEKIYQMISSDMGEGNINMMNLSPITNQMPPPEMPGMGVGEGATEVPEIASVNMANPYRQLTPMLYGITV